MEEEGPNRHNFQALPCLCVNPQQNSHAIPASLLYLFGTCKGGLSKADFSNESSATWLWLWCHYPGGGPHTW